MKIKQFKQLNESSYDDFLNHYREELDNAIKLLIKLKDCDIENDDQIQSKIERKLEVYDKNVPDQIDHWIYDTPTKNEIVDFAIRNQNRWGTEPRMVLSAIEDYGDACEVYLEDEDEDDEDEFFEGSFQFEKDNENVEVDNYTSRYYDNFDDEEPAANEDDLQNFSPTNKKIHLFEDFK
jgi:hypothetical protein